MHSVLLKLCWFISLITLVFANDYELDKVLVFSRHNVRAPLGNAYSRYSPRPWPSWSDEVGTLTRRGHLLEKNLAKYLSLWLEEEKFTVDCPKDVNIYTNNYERTISSGFAFAEGAFPKCALNIRYKNRTTIDPIFSLDSRNLTRKFEEEVQEYMKNKLLNIDFKGSLELVQNIIDLKNSPKCKEEGICDLVSGEHTINIKANIEPVLSGPIAIANKFVDTFLMQYYNGFDLKDVAWGLIKNETEWKMLLDINKYYHDIIFNDTNIARDISLPLVKLLKESLLNGSTKFNYLVGHDGNIFTMFRIMNFKPYELPENYEITPVGGKIVFQKWYNRESDRFLLKVEYVYASFKQLRDLQELSLENPPKRVTLEMEGCPIDHNAEDKEREGMRTLVEDRERKNKDTFVNSLYGGDGSESSISRWGAAGGGKRSVYGRVLSLSLFCSDASADGVEERQTRHKPNAKPIVPLYRSFRAFARTLGSGGTRQ